MVLSLIDIPTTHQVSELSFQPLGLDPTVLLRSLQPVFLVCRSYVTRTGDHGVMTVTEMGCDDDSVWVGVEVNWCTERELQVSGSSFPGSSLRHTPVSLDDRREINCLPTSSRRKVTLDL